MKKNNNKTWKRIAAGALSLALVAGALPANVGGLLTGGKGIEAHAADPNNIPTAVTPNDAGIIQHNGTTYTAVPAEGYHFDHWNITGYFYPENDPLISTENPYTFSSNNYNYYTITAVFAEDPVITDISTANITATASTYNGSALTPTIKLGDTTLTNGTDYTYTVTDSNNQAVDSVVNAGTYHVKVTAVDGSNYTGEKTVEWTVSPITLTNDNLVAGGELVNGVPSQLTYTGEEQAVKLYYKNGNNYVQLTAGTDYELDPNYSEGEPYDGYVVHSAATDAYDRYEVFINPKGNYKVSDSGNNSLFVGWSIAKANLKAGTDYTAPTGSGDLKYKDTAIPLLKDGNTGSVTNDSNTGEPVGTMKYAATRYRAVSANELHISSIDDVAVGDIYNPKSNQGINFPVGYKIQVGNKTYTHMMDSNGVNFYLSSAYNKCYFSATNVPLDYNALMITEIDKVNKTITAEGVDYNTAFNALVNDLQWNEGVPQSSDLGNWYVWYKVEGDANHNSTKPAYVTSKIDYNKSTLTLADSLGKFKVTEVANGTETEVTGNNGVYTLTATNEYKIYTENIVSTDEKSKYRLTEAFHDKANDDDVFEYEYTLKLPVEPAFGAYNLSHLSNWTGKVSSTDPTKLYIADGEVTPNTGKLAATLKANSTYYYGDLIDDSSVEIEEAYKDLLKVKKIYFSDSTGANVDINNAKYGTYTLTAEIVVDNNANGQFDDKDVDLSYTVYKNVEYKARPMNKNDYFLLLGDKEYKLEIPEDSQTVTVPNTYWWNTKTDEISLTKPEEEDTSSGGEPVEGEPEQDQESNWVEETLYTYDQQDHIPEIVVRNGGNNEIVLTEGTRDDTDKDYSNSRKNADGEYEAGKYKDAGSHYYQLIANRNSTKYEVATYVNIQWTIAKADINGYISVAPKNNVDTDEVVGNDAIVYDGAVLDGTDFEVTKSEAYDNGGPIVKALVDEFIAQLTATPATETTPAVAAKTVVSNVSATQEQTKALLSSYKDSNGKVTTDTFSRSIVDCDLTIDPYSNNNGNITGAEYISIYNSTTMQWVVNRAIIGANGGTITYNSETHGIQIGETVLTPSNGKYFEIAPNYRSSYGSNNLNVTALAITESDLTASVQTTPKNAGDYKANVTVSNSNFEDIVFNDQDVTIAKRDVTLTPDEDLSMTYRDTAMPDLTYTIEDAKADGLTGVIAADKALFQKTTGEGADAVTTNTGAIYVDELVQEDTTAAAVNFVYALDENNATDYTTAGLNNAGSYKYAVINDAKFDNYNIVLPVDIAADEAQGIEEYTAPTFTVAPLNLNNIANLSIVLNGLSGTETNPWVPNVSSGSYIYDGSTKQVGVTKVSKSGSLTTDLTIYYNTEGTDGFTWTGYVPDGTSYFKVDSSNGFTLTVPAGKIATSIYVDSEYNTAGEVSNSSQTYSVGYTGTVDIRELIGADYTDSGNYTAIKSIAVTYKDIDEYVLNEDTDYTVGGATKRASAGTHNVQIVGKGNYTGVVKAPWQIITAEAGEAALTLGGGVTADTGSYDYSKTYDGKAVTGTVTFTDSDSPYALDAEVEYKYYQGIYTKEQVTAAGFNATAIDAPVNAYYPNPAGGNYSTHAGEYTVVATITCDGYADQVLVKTVHISQKALAFDGNYTATKNVTYGDALPAVTQADIDAISGLTDTDRAFFEQLLADGKLEFAYLQTAPDTYDYTKVQIVPTFSSEEELNAIRNFYFNYNMTNVRWNVAKKAKSIKDSSIKIDFTAGDTIVLNADGTFASDNAIKVYDTAILDTDGKATELVELGTNNAATADYELTVESTATEGVYTLELIGKNNYRGVRKVKFTAITAAQNATTFTENAPKALNNGKTRVVCSYDVAVADGFTITEKGLLYCNNGSVTDVSALVLNSGNASIKTAKNYTSGNIVDNGQGVICVAYAKVMDADGNTEVVYSGNLGGKYSELMSTFTENAPKAMNNGKNRVVCSYSVAAAEGCEITEQGLIYSNDGSVTDVSALVLNSGNASIKTAKNYTSGNIVDNGYGVIAVAYAKVTDSAGNKSVIYSGNLGGKYTELIAAFTENAPKAMNNGKNRVVCSYSVAAAEGYTLDEQGLIYSNDGTVTDVSALVLDSGNASIKTAKDYTSGNIVDKGYGVIAVAYAKVTDSNGNTTVVYSGDLGGKYAVLQIS